MRQLTSLDAQFLAIENNRQTGHVGGLTVLDPSTVPGGATLDFDRINSLLVERLPLLPPMRWKLAEVPLGLDYPYWVDDPCFDLEYHLRELALPAPGNDSQMGEQIARIMSRPLDRSRPLWEMYLISGLESGKVALLSKIHHALSDGLSGAEIMGILLDFDQNGRETPPPTPSDARQPGTLEMLGRAALSLPRYPMRVISSAPAVLRNLPDTQYRPLPAVKQLDHLVGFVGDAIGGLLGRPHPRVVRTELKAPMTSFNGRLSPHRRFAFGDLPLDRVKALKNTYGCTVNDVVVAICAGAVRRWLTEHDELPGDPLVAQIPVSVRTSSQMGTYGNRILLLGVPLFTNQPDPVRRLEQTMHALKDLKSRHKALPATLLQDANNFVPPSLFSRAAGSILSLAAAGAVRPVWNLVISNVPGPQFPLYCAGARVVAQYPVSVITDAMGMNLTVMSYNGTLCFGVIADRDQVKDVWCLIAWLEEALVELEQAAGSSGATAGRAAKRSEATSAR